LLTFWKKIKKDLFARHFQNKMIGLFLGDTDFSEIVLKKIKKLNKKYFIIDFSKNNKFKKNKNSHRISIGKFGEIIKLIKEKKSKKV
jgi:UDP-2,3-diacylglucosamine hydrolase